MGPDTKKAVTKMPVLYERLFIFVISKQPDAVKKRLVINYIDISLSIKGGGFLSSLIVELSNLLLA